MPNVPSPAPTDPGHSRPNSGAGPRPPAEPLASGPVLLTGAAGFIGSHLAEALLAHGRRVVGVDNFDPFYPRALKEANLRAVRAHPALRDDPARFELAELDLCDAPALRALLERTRPVGVIHLAAKAGVRPSLADPVAYTRANLLATSVLLDEAHRAGVTRAVVASSSSVYGNNSKVPFSEDDPADHPISPYAATKRATELLCQTHAHVTGMATSCLRFFTVYGPRQRPDLAIGRFLRLASRGEPISMFGNGATSRDYTFVDDIVAGVLAAEARTPAQAYRVWNLGGNNPTRLDELLTAVGRTVGREPVLRHAPAQLGDVERTWADLTRARAELGYAPRTTLEEGLRRQWAWMREQAAG